MYGELAYKNFYGLTWNEFIGWVSILPLNHGPRSDFESQADVEFHLD
jgi:hypothetical protein